MSRYRRVKIPGGTYFFTQVTYLRNRWLCKEISRHTLRKAIELVKQQYPFTIDAFVLLPDHFHCIWTLPPGDADYSNRMRLIKVYMTKNCGKQLNISAFVGASRQKRRESNLWQRRFWEHYIRDENDFERHCDYIHYNPVKHGLCSAPKDWQYSSFHRFVCNGVYPSDWGINQVPSNINIVTGE